MMEIRDIIDRMTGELRDCLAGLNAEEIAVLEREIRGAERVFVAGAGRSLLMIRAFAMRLMHLGYTAYVVGETVTPSIREGDLLIVASGSGATPTMRVIAENCKRFGARLALITAVPDSPIVACSDLIVTVNAATPKNTDNQRKTAQPGANTFEQSVLLIGDAIIIDLIGEGNLETKNAELMWRHANLE